MRDEPNERITDRAVALWIRMLRNPKYDNMGETGTPEERQINAMAGKRASMRSSNATNDILALFGKELRRRILDSEQPLYSRTSLSVDYGPDTILADAAEHAGLEMQFPWKTNIYIRSTCLSVSFGYGAEAVYHYPMDDGRWLVTCLHGSDIHKVIDYVTGGAPAFDVEEAEIAL